MKPKQRGRWGANVKAKRRGARRKNLVDGKERYREGVKGQRKRHDTILKMGSIRGMRSLIVGQMK